MRRVLGFDRIVLANYPGTTFLFVPVCKSLTAHPLRRFHAGVDFDYCWAMKALCSKRPICITAHRSGRAKSWLKIKNPKCPAMLRLEEGTF